MIESATIESVADVLLKGGPIGLAALGTLILLLTLTFRLRTSSTHTIFRWIWRLIFGRAPSSDREFNSFMDAQDDLHQFRFICGKARTTTQMHLLINWSTQHNEDMTDIKACGFYFDRERPCLKPANQRPTRALLALMTVGLASLTALSILFTMFATGPAALINIKDTNTVLLINMRSTRAFLHPATERLSPDDCRKPLEKISEISGFGKRDINVICSLYAEPKLSEFIEKTIWEQRWFFVIFAIPLLRIYFLLFSRVRQADAALKMATRLDRR